MTDSYPWTARITFRAGDIDAVHDRVDQLDYANATAGDLDGPLELDRDRPDSPTGRVTIPVRGRLDNPPAVLAITDATVAAVKDAQTIADILGVDGPPIGVDVREADPERHTSREDVPRLLPDDATLLALRAEGRSYDDIAREFTVARGAVYLRVKQAEGRQYPPRGDRDRGSPER